MDESKLDEIKALALQEIPVAATPHALAEVKAKWLGRHGVVTAYLKELPQAKPEDRPRLGKRLNQLKQELEAALRVREGELSAVKKEMFAKTFLDVTRPGSGGTAGRPHVLIQTLDEITTVFQRLGFSVVEGPEVETDYYNFQALNIPEDHPARDMHDTFYLSDGKLLRTHTSPVQIHIMEQVKPPFSVIVPGRVYRRDLDATHSPIFHQVEGLSVADHVTLGDLKQTLSHFLHAMFGPDQSVRFRPSYFPFTEPSMEVDVSCAQCQGKGCALCKGTGWLEILGAGMVDPNVFQAVGYDPERVTGFAFGLGVERIAMLKYGVSDIRLFFENDVRFLQQF